MDEESILHEIVKSLAFEIEAVNQDNVLKWSTTNGTPLNVKVRVRNKDEPRLIQRGAIPVPRIGITAPEKLRLISSDQTILSFNVYLEDGLEKESKRNNIFKKFHIGSCLGTYSDDEGPYLPGPSEHNALGTDSDINTTQRNSSKSEIDFLKEETVSPILDYINKVPQNQKRFFGKCKPGGCLDPPFGEENYAYSHSKADRKENIQLKLQENKNSHEPGGCLDPSFSEDIYSYNKPIIQQHKTLELKTPSITDKQKELSIKSLEESDQYKTQDRKSIKDEDDTGKLKNIYARISKENLLESNYSNSIITYATDVSSNETLNDKIPNKKLSIKSNHDETRKQSYNNPVSYFVPPKDVMRHKEEERRYSRRLSSDISNTSSKGTGSDEADKNYEHVKLSQNVLISKDIYENYPPPNFASKSYHTQKDEVSIKQVNSGPDSVIKSPSDDIEHTVKEKKIFNKTTREGPTKSYSDKDDWLIPSNNDKSNYEKTGSLKENIQIEKIHTSGGIPLIKEAGKDIKDVLPHSELSYITSDPTTDRLGTRREKLDIVSKTQEKQEYSKFSNIQSPLEGDNQINGGTSKKIIVAEAALPFSATSTLALSEKQSTEFSEKSKIGFNSLMIENNKVSVSNTISRDLVQQTSDHKVQEDPMTLSPQCISSSENNEFDVSSEHSIDSRHDLKNNLETHKPEATLAYKDKQDILADGLYLKRHTDVISEDIVLKDQFIKDPECQKIRTSEILQKKPFTARHDLDIEQDDIDRTTPIKRKTFPAIVSDTSLQKSDNIEELPEIITDVHFKTTNIPKFGSTENITHISDTNIEKQVIKVSPSQKAETGKTNNLHSKVSDDNKPFISSIIDQHTKETENRFDTNFDGNIPFLVSQNLTDMSRTINETNAFDSLQNQNKVNYDPSPNLIPTYIRDIELNIDKRESLLTVKSRQNTDILETKYQDSENFNENYKDVQLLHNPEYIQDYNISTSKEKAMGNQFIENILLSEPSKDSLHKTKPDYAKDIHENTYVSDKSSVYQTDNMYLGKNESKILLNIDSNTSVQNKHTENMPSTPIADDNLFTDLGERLPEKNSIHFNDNYVSFPETRDKVEFIGIKEVNTNENMNITHSSDNSTMDESQKNVPTNLQPNYNNRYLSVDSKSKVVLNTYDNSEVNSTHTVMPQPESGSVINNKPKDTSDPKYLDYKELDDTEHGELSMTFISNNAPKHIDDTKAGTADDKKYNNIDHLYDKHEYFDTHGNEQPAKVELAEHIDTEKIAKNSIHSDRYSDLISGVLSNISENREGEESNTVQNISIERREDIVKLDDKISNGRREVDTEHASISKKSELIMVDHIYEDSIYKRSINSFIENPMSTLRQIDNISRESTKIPTTTQNSSSFDNSKQQSDVYERNNMQLNISKEIVFLDDTTNNNDQPSEYGSSINDFKRLKTNNSRSKHIKANNGPPVHNKQPSLTKVNVQEKSNIIDKKSTPLRKDISPLYLDMSFYSYVDDNKQRVVQTQSPLIKRQTPNDGTITSVKTLIRHGKEIRIPVDNDNDITLNILEKDVKLDIRNSIVGLPTSHTRRDKLFDVRAKKHNEILNKNLSLIYESELIPLQTVIKDLTQEVDTLAKKQEILQMRMRNTKRTKSLRLIPVVKRCGCRRI